MDHLYTDTYQEALQIERELDAFLSQTEVGSTSINIPLLHVIIRNLGLLALKVDDLVRNYDPMDFQCPTGILLDLMYIKGILPTVESNMRSIGELKLSEDCCSQCLAENLFILLAYYDNVVIRLFRICLSLHGEVTS